MEHDINNIGYGLRREQAKQETGILTQTLKLLKLGREANIQAENATFDRWFFVPWFIKEVLVTRQIGLGKAKNGNTEVHRDTQSFTEEKINLFFKKLCESLCPSVNLCVN
ncbi:hypothetical protein QUF58_10855 [Anaerolineales bacterium HSG24]|nr:hypothetical protein [Anaerolineales bacterium HSG24]